jgi:hypothetical protein
MEHAKKLMLVEPKLFRQSMKEKTLTRLDEEIEQTLSSDLPDNEKAIKYIAALQRYKYYDAPKEVTEKKVDVETDILASVPDVQRHKAKRLLDYLKRDADVKIGENGEFIYRQEKLPQSHVGELINDILKKKSPAGESPRGWREFSNSLKSLRVPKDLIENTERWKYMYAPVEKVKRVRQIAPVLTPEPLTRNRKRKSIRPRWLEYDDVE